MNISSNSQVKSIKVGTPVNLRWRPRDFDGEVVGYPKRWTQALQMSLVHPSLGKKVVVRWDDVGDEEIWEADLKTL